MDLIDLQHKIRYLEMRVVSNRDDELYRSFVAGSKEKTGRRNMASLPDVSKKLEVKPKKDNSRFRLVDCSPGSPEVVAVGKAFAAAAYKLQKETGIMFR